MVADISVSGTKLHVSYSDGTSKDMDMPPATSLRLPYSSKYYGIKGYSDITGVREEGNTGAWFTGTTYYPNFITGAETTMPLPSRGR